MKPVSIYTDGSCSNNPGPGGFAAILQCGEHTREITGGEPTPPTTAWNCAPSSPASKRSRPRATSPIYADSQYAIGAFTGNKINKNADLITAGLLKIEAIKTWAGP